MTQGLPDLGEGRATAEHLGRRQVPQPMRPVGAIPHRRQAQRTTPAIVFVEIAVRGAMAVMNTLREAVSGRSPRK